MFSADSNRVAYGARKWQKWRVVVDGKVGSEYDGIRALAFSVDSKRLAYLAKDGQKCRVVVDGQAGPAFNGIGEATPLFSARGSRMAYLAQNG